MTALRTTSALALVLAVGCYSGSLPADEATAAESNESSASSGDPSGDSNGDDPSGGDPSGDDPSDDDPSDDSGEPAAEPLAELDRFTSADAAAYLGTIAPMIVGRLLSPTEVNLLEYFGGRGIVPVLEAWFEDPAFAETARMMFQIKLHASGASGDIDYELPGNLAARIARRHLPLATMITADACVDNDGEWIPCDTGAPYTAGVLTTRAYLRGNSSRFNLQRARRMMFIFNCLVYPMDTALQPPLAKDSMIPMFRAETPDEQTVPEAANGFGNGFACYGCHSQFGAHSQLFVKFDESGLFHGEATGLQDPENELGRSIDGLYVSHFVDPVAAHRELSQVFGQPVSNLREAAEVMSDHPTFYQCGARNIIEWTFGLTEAEAATTSLALLREIADRVLADDPRPSLTAIFKATLAHPAVIDVVLGTAPDPAPDPATDPAIPGALR